MSDEVQETAGAAARNLLGAVGFITILIGAEMMAEKTGDRFGLGFGLVVGGIPIFFSGVFWKWLQRKLASGVSGKINEIAKDPRWWIAFLFILMGISYGQMSYVASHWDAGGGSLGWIWLGFVGLAFLYVIMTWRKLGIIVENQPKNKPVVALKNNPETERDILLLLDYAVDQSTAGLLSSLLDSAPIKIVADPDKGSAERYEDAKSFVRRVTSALANSQRAGEIAYHLSAAEGEAERMIRSNPPEVPEGTNLLDVRAWVIANLQCTRLYDYLWRQRKEVQDRALSKRSSLVDRLNERSPR